MSTCLEASCPGSVSTCLEASCPGSVPTRTQLVPGFDLDPSPHVHKSYLGLTLPMWWYREAPCHRGWRLTSWCWARCPRYQRHGPWGAGSGRCVADARPVGVPLSTTHEITFKFWHRQLNKLAAQNSAKSVPDRQTDRRTDKPKTISPILGEQLSSYIRVQYEETKVMRPIWYSVWQTQNILSTLNNDIKHWTKL